MKYKLKNDFPHDETCGVELLKERGVQDVNRYLNLDEFALNDFMDLDNIREAAALLQKHISNDSNIFLIVDSDSDGYNSAAILYLYIKDINPNAKIDFGVHEGKHHGIIVDNVPENTDLLIVSDAGTNDFEEHKELKEKGVDLIVIDHHIGERYSEDAVVVNNQLSENYPNKTLSGGGVVYKFCQCYDSIYGYNFANKYLDLVAIALIGDMMDLRDHETRYLIEQGLKNIQNAGLKALVKKQAYSIGDVDKITPTNVAWYITPLINAIVRVGTREEKETMFMALINGDKPLKSTKRGAKEGDTETAAEQTARVSTNARNRQNRLKEGAIDKLESRVHKNDLLENKILFLELDETDDFPPTLNGLIAMNLSSKFKKPTILARRNDDGYLRGSARGLNESELKDFKGFLESTGKFEYTAGHPGAFGISIKDSDLNSMHDIANEELSNVDFSENTYEVDFVFNSNENLALPLMKIGELTPYWGQGIAEPYVVVKDIVLKASELFIMGKDGASSKFTKGGVAFVKFKDLEFIKKIQEHQEVDITIVGRVNLNEWCGEITPQIFIDDYTLASPNLRF